MKYPKKKHLQVKILQNLEILPCQNTLVVYFFFFQSNFALTKILTTIEYFNLQ